MHHSVNDVTESVRIEKKEIEKTLDDLKAKIHNFFSGTASSLSLITACCQC